MTSIARSITYLWDACRSTEPSLSSTLLLRLYLFLLCYRFEPSNALRGINVCSHVLQLKMTGAPRGSVESDPAWSSSNMSVACSSQVLPWVEVGDVLTLWEEFADWKQHTTRLIQFYGGMSVEGVVSPEYEDQALMIASARLSRPVLKRKGMHSAAHSRKYGRGWINVILSLPVSSLRPNIWAWCQCNWVHWRVSRNTCLVLMNVWQFGRLLPSELTWRWCFVILLVGEVMVQCIMLVLLSLFQVCVVRVTHWRPASRSGWQKPIKKKEKKNFNNKK